MALPPSPESDRGQTARAHRLLGLALALSLAAHLAIVLVLPGFRTPETSPPRPLEVVIVQPPVPQPVVKAEPAPSKPKREIEKPKPRAVLPEPPRPSSPARAPEPRLLALPEPAPAAPAPSFTVPQASVEPAPATEAKPSAPASASAASSGTAREAVAATPPSFNAAYLRNAPPRYPAFAQRRGIEGTVRLKVLVTKEGRPAQVQLEQTSGASVLDTAAIEAVKSWQFVPARRGQEAIESWVIVPVVFKLETPS